MNKKDQQAIKEILFATKLHREKLKETIFYNNRLGFAEMREMISGMDISIDKLEILLKEKS